jgi:hypothetical protein
VDFHPDIISENVANNIDSATRSIFIHPFFVIIHGIPQVHGVTAKVRHIPLKQIISDYHVWLRIALPIRGINGYGSTESPYIICEGASFDNHWLIIS